MSEYFREDKLQVWACGGGTQSVAVAALIVQGRLPKPHFSVIADTGFEVSSTWDYMDRVLVPKLRRVGVELIRISKAEFSYEHDGLFNKKGSSLIPAFTDFSGEKGKHSAFCNRWWKQDVMLNYFRRVHQLKRADMVKWIGFSMDEARRAMRMQAGEEFAQGLIRFPLIYDVPMSRSGCVDLVVREMGWPQPPRSRCWLCPNQQDEEWASLTRKEFQQACRMDEGMRRRDPNLFLHESLQPLRRVRLNVKREAGERSCDSGVCFL